MSPTSADAADLRFDGLVLFRVLPFLSWRGSAEEIGGRAGLGAAGVLAGAFLRRPIQSDVLLTDLAIVQGRIEHTVLLSCGDSCMLRWIAHDAFAQDQTSAA